LDGRRGVVASGGNIVQKNGVERRAREGGKGLWNSSTGSLDGNIVVLLEINTGVLFGRVVGVAEKFLLQKVAARANNVSPILPSTVTKSGSVAAAAPVLLLVGVPAPGRVGTIHTPSVPTTVGCDMATTSTSIVDGLSRKGVVTAKRWCGRAGVVPAVPRRMKLSVMDMMKKDRPYPSVGREGVEAARC
jgi:hypothetical protein